MMERDLFSDIDKKEVVVKNDPIIDEFDAFHERIKDWFEHPEQPTKGRIKL